MAKVEASAGRPDRTGTRRLGRHALGELDVVFVAKLERTTGEAPLAVDLRKLVGVRADDVETGFTFLEPKQLVQGGACPGAPRALDLDRRGSE